MKEKFFKTSGVLLTIAIFEVSLILGIRSGIMANNVFEGLKVGGACALGAVLFALGMGRFTKSGYDNLLANVCWGVSLIGITILGASLIAVSISDITNINPFIIEKGLMLGAGMFIVPIICAAAYFCIKKLIEEGKKNKRLFCVSLGIATVLATIMYLISGTLSEAFAVFFSFLFYWIGVCFFIYAWEGVKYDEYAKLWRIGFTMVFTFLGCGILYIMSVLFKNVQSLYEMLLWVSYKVGVFAMYSLLIYIGLIVIAMVIIRIYRRFKN